MYATDDRQRLISPASLFAARGGGAVPIALIAGVAVAALVALAFLLMPVAVIEDLAADSGIAAWLPAAAPPLGNTARLLLTFVAAALGGGATWLGLTLIFGPPTSSASDDDDDVDEGVPVLRRADAHPDAPPRRPVFAASDLGTPFLDVKAEPVVEDAPEPEPPLLYEVRVVPTDLDTPLAHYRTPTDAPLPDPEPAPSLSSVLTAISAPRFAPHERIETFGLAAASSDDEPSAPLPQATIHDLLERLERGVTRRGAEPEQPREKTLEETLDALRALARSVA